jgi:hypothetical protein
MICVSLEYGADCTIWAKVAKALDVLVFQPCLPIFPIVTPGNIQLHNQPVGFVISGVRILSLTVGVFSAIAPK